MVSSSISQTDHLTKSSWLQTASLDRDSLWSWSIHSLLPFHTPTAYTKRKRITLSYLCGGRQSSHRNLPVNTPSVYKPHAELVSSCRGVHYTTGHLNQRKTQSWLQTPSSFKGVAVEVITPVIATLVYSKRGTGVTDSLAAFQLIH